MKWFNIETYRSIRNEHLMWHKENPALFKKASFLYHSSMVIFPIIMLLLYYMRDQILPKFLFDLSDTLKYEIFFDRYLYLIKHGGVEFSDRFFIAYAILVTANAIVFIPVFTFGWIFVRRSMTPVERIAKRMKMSLLSSMIILMATALYILIFGDGLNQIGYYRANDRTLFHLLFVGSILPSTAFLHLISMKFIFVAYDSWRDGTFREVVLSKS